MRDDFDEYAEEGHRHEVDGDVGEDDRYVMLMLVSMRTTVEGTKVTAISTQRMVTEAKMMRIKGEDDDDKVAEDEDDGKEDDAGDEKL